MCTLTIIPANVGASRDAGDAIARFAAVRIACNRDESRLRPRALPPELRALGPRRALMPIDPAGGGTWIAASDAGLALVLMNVYVRPITSWPPPQRKTPSVSRGTIIPEVAAAAGLDEALERARSLDLARFEPFRLIMVDLERRAEVEWSDGQFKVMPPARVAEPWFCTSSGMGDAVVAAPRRRLFAESFTAEADWQAAQDAFHRYQWPDRPEASVWMTRPEARTVSLTVVELGPRAARMSYYARDDDRSSAEVPVQTTLAIVGPRADVAS